MDKLAEDHYPVVNVNDLNEEGRRRLRAILGYRNESVIMRYADDAGVGQEVAEKTFLGLKQYLAVCVFMGGKRTPAKVIDECWHTFILHMKDYDDFCRAHTRGIVYHDPAIDNSGMDYYLRTRAGAEALCGELDPEIWPVDHDLYARCVSTKSSEPPRFADCIQTKSEAA